MAVHVPLSIEAQVESRVLMMSTNNILSPANGKPIIVPSQDIVLGLYYMTRERPFALGENKAYSSSDEVWIAYQQQETHLQAKIRCRIDGVLTATTVGRVMLYHLCPRVLPFANFNKVMKKKEISQLIDECFRVAGNKATVLLADKLKDVGYYFATISGISIGVQDMVIPDSKIVALGEADAKVSEIDNQYREGLVTAGERYNKVIDIWSDVGDKIAEDIRGRM
jgi:DNA-directed RNA polymerase subunit beta'